MKRFLILLLVLLVMALPACAQEKLSILATVFPAYDFARTIAGETAQVELLLPPGSESHSYEPTPKDIISIQSADLFLYVGGESDHWVEGILESLGDSAPETFRLSDSVVMLKSETSASMQHAHEHDHKDCDDPHHQHEMDEHVWTSPKNAMRIVQSLADTLSAIQPAFADQFAQNLAAYLDELSALDAEFEQIVSNGKRSMIVFGDRFPMRYFAADYGLSYDAAFPGCSEDSEPSVRTVISLVDKVREEHIPVIFYIEFSSRRTADILAEETGAKPMLFHSCHNVGADELDETYLTLMRRNAAALKEALN